MDKLSRDRLETYALKRIPKLLEEMGAKSVPYVLYVVYVVDMFVLFPNASYRDVCRVVGKEFDLSWNTIVWHIGGVMRDVNKEHPVTIKAICPKKKNITGKNFVKAVADQVRKEFVEKDEAEKTSDK